MHARGERKHTTYNDVSTADIPRQYETPTGRQAGVFPPASWSGGRGLDVTAPPQLDRQRHPAYAAHPIPRRIMILLRPHTHTRGGRLRRERVAVITGFGLCPPCATKGVVGLDVAGNRTYQWSQDRQAIAASFRERGCWYPMYEHGLFGGCCGCYFGASDTRVFAKRETERE